MKPNRTGPAMVILGTIIAVAGFAVTVIYIFQPWRSCDYDDSPAACSMLPFDAAVLVIAMVATIIGVILAVAGVVIRYRTRGVQTRNPM